MLVTVAGNVESGSKIITFIKLRSSTAVTVEISTSPVVMIVDACHIRLLLRRKLVGIIDGDGDSCVRLS